jgi:Fur family transcriptional regulator, ferric uptake regulator
VMRKTAFPREHRSGLTKGARSTRKYTAKETRSDPIGIAGARQLLRQAELRATAPRLAVLRVLLRERRPVSHSEVTRALNPDGIDRVTVFRNLHDLAAAGILARVDVGDHTWRFELGPAAQSSRQHSHFICERCSLVSCLNDFNVNLLPPIPALSAIVASVSDVVLRGCCRRC